MGKYPQIVRIWGYPRSGRYPGSDPRSWIWPISWIWPKSMDLRISRIWRIHGSWGSRGPEGLADRMAGLAQNHGFGLNTTFWDLRSTFWSPISSFGRFYQKHGFWHFRKLSVFPKTVKKMRRSVTFFGLFYGFWEFVDFTIYLPKLTFLTFLK